ncbi:MAG: Protein archease [Phycisphaerae bacterium]|nr:Protein archease [Phycisphaerae bacterium]
MVYRFELFDHTADLGICLQADSLAELLPAAAAGLYAALGDMQPMNELQPWTYSLQDADAAYLLHDFVAELLALSERQQLMLVQIEQAKLIPPDLEIQGQLARIDELRSSFDREIKAVTYHRLEVRQTPTGWTATLIIDI